MSNNPKDFEKLFNELSAVTEFETSSVMPLIHLASKDVRLIQAVYKEGTARLASLPFLNDIEDMAVQEKLYEEAVGEVWSIAALLQDMYKLDDKSILQVVELARIDIQNNKDIYD